MLRGSQEANRLELIKYISLHNFDMFIYIEKGKNGMLVTHIYVYITECWLHIYICLYNFDAGKIYIDMFIYIGKGKTECWLHIYMFI